MCRSCVAVLTASCLTATTTVAAAPGETVHRVNVGGPGTHMPDGGTARAPEADGIPPPAGGTAYGHPVNGADATVPETVPPELFRTERFEPSPDRRMTWFQTGAWKAYGVRLSGHNASKVNEAFVRRSHLHAPSVSAMMRLTAAILAVCALTVGPGDAAAQSDMPSKQPDTQPARLDEGLVGYWMFDEPAGDRVIDHSGHGHDGEIIHGGRTDGIAGGAVSLTGRSDSHFTVPSSGDFDGIANGMTVAAWVWPEVPPDGFRVVVSRQIGELLHPDQFYLGFGTKDGAMHYKWHIATDDNGTLRQRSIYVGDPAHGRWIHMAGTFDGATMRLYVDGAEIGSSRVNGTIRVGDNPITIGGEENGPLPRVVDGELSGRVDEVRLYDRPLSADEIVVLVQSGGR